MMGDSSDADSEELQQELVKVVRIRDELFGLPHACAACGSTSAKLEVAHVVAWSTGSETAMREYGLIDGLYSTRNGFQLCRGCHWYYEQRHWHVRTLDDGTENIVVSDALLALEQTLPDEVRRFTRLHGKALGLPAPSARGRDGWPTPEMWKAQRSLCEAARVARRPVREPMLGRCARCDKPYTSIAALRKHKDDCEGAARLRRKRAATCARATALLEVMRRYIEALADGEPDTDSVLSADTRFDRADVAVAAAAHAAAGKPGKRC